MRRIVRGLFNLGLAGSVLALAHWHATGNGYATFGTFRVPWLLAFTLAVMVISYGFGVPDVGQVWPGVRRTFGAVLGSLALISSAQLLLGTPLLPRSVLFGATAILPLWGGLASYVAGKSRQHQANRDRVVAIVEPNEEEQLRIDLNTGLEREVTLVEAIELGDGPVDIGEWVEDSGATILVLGRTAANDDSVVTQASVLHASGLRIRTLLSFYEEWVGKLPVSELRRSSLLFDISDVHRSFYRRTSRLLDIAVAILVWPILLVMLPLVAMGNVFGNRGPLFFRQSRVGRSGSEFEIVKFRSMTPGTGSTEWTADGDARITRFGSFLRSSHIDELPQLINIVRGDISVVGPRPEQPHYVDQLAESIPFYNTRHIVQPGLTGWAQVNYRYGNTTFDALEKLQFEFYYLRHQSIWLDLRIIARTGRRVLRLRGT